MKDELHGSLRRLFALAFSTLLIVCAGCERVTHDMAEQPRYNSATSSAFFADTQSQRPPVAGSVARAAGDLATISGGRKGALPDHESAHETPGVAADEAQATPSSDAAMVPRGGARYAIYCEPCHGARGDGDGEVVKRGFPAPPALSDSALRSASGARLHDAIRLGVGRMYAFNDRVSDADAWAIVAYMRVLQQRASPASDGRAKPEARP